MQVLLVHHGDAVGPEVDPRRPLSGAGTAHVARLAADAAARGFKPAVVWHSGKLRAKQTAEAIWRACNPFAELAATRDLQPADPPAWMRDRLRAEPRDLAIVGHFPHLPALLGLMIHGSDGTPAPFPPHGAVALETADEGGTWTERWRIAS